MYAFGEMLTLKSAKIVSAPPFLANLFLSLLILDDWLQQKAIC